MSDENLINVATGKNNLSLSEIDAFQNFLENEKQGINIEGLIKVQKPLSDHEIIKKNKLKKQINALSIEYNISPELICTSRNLINFVKGEDLFTINQGWRSKIFKI